MSLACLLVLTLGCAPAASAVGQPTVRIGVLAMRGVAETRARWLPTADYLAKVLPGQTFEIVPMGYPELDRATAQRQIDFILTNPDHFAVLRAAHGLAALATLMPSVEGHPLTQFGGVIFCRSDRVDLRSLADLRGRRIAAPDPHSLGGYLAQRSTLEQQGIALERDVQMVYTGMPHDAVVRRVLQRQVDVGFVRTGVLEAMATEGKLTLDQIRVINPQPQAGFPQRLSTELYPEWPLAAMRDVPDTLRKAVTLALFAIAPDSPAARDGGYYGFTPPEDYSRVEALMVRMRVNPDRLDSFDARDIVTKYSAWLVPSLSLLLAITLVVSFRQAQLARRVRRASRERALVDAEIGQTRQRLALALDASQISLWDYDLVSGVVYLDENWATMLGHPRVAATTSIDALLELVHPEDRDAYQRAALAAVKGLSADFQTDFRCRDAHGAWKWITTRGKVVARDHAGRGLRAIGTNLDISRQKADQAALEASQRRFQDLAMISSDWLWEQDAQFRFVSITGDLAATDPDGQGHSVYLGKTRWELDVSGLNDSDWQAHRDQLERHESFEDFVYQILDGHGHPRWCSISGKPVYDTDGSFIGYRGVGRDVTERRAAEARIHHLAHVDALTELPNRFALTARMAQACANADRYGRRGALLFLDLDRFKTINDSLGHTVGDGLLVEVARRLEHCVRASDTVARLGGDEFVLLLPEIDELTDAAATARRVLSQFVEPFHLPQRMLHATPSIGIAIYPLDGASPEALMRCADTAMYRAKALGGNGFQFFTSAMNAAAEERLRIEGELRHALERREISIHWQPQIDLQDQSVAGFEVLARWEHPGFGNIPPDRFIPVAEETGLIVALGEEVLRQACRQGRELIAAGCRIQRISVNLSVRQAQAADFVDRVAAILQLLPLPHGVLAFELTESAVMERPEQMAQVLHRLRALGIQLAVDDFGTGYSSLSYLKLFPIHHLKIDRSFVQDIESDANDRIIAFSTIALAHSLGLRVVAEGVERAGQAELLRVHGCDEVQGYFYARPMPQDQVLAWYAAWVGAAIEA